MLNNLENYLFKHVIVIDINDVEHKGYVNTFTPDYDNDEMAEDSIGILPRKNDKIGIELYASEIKTIEMID